MTALVSPVPPGAPQDDPVETGRTRATRRAARLRSNPATLLAGLVLAAILLAALAPGLLSTHDPFAPHSDEVLLPPSGTYWLGTDYLGRDIYSRLVHGTGMSVVSALIAVAIGLVAGSAIGLVGGHWADRPIDVVLMRIVDTLLAIPGLLLSMAIVVALGFSTVNAAIAVGVSAIAVFARLMRSEVLRIRSLPYLEAAELVGARSRALILSHILPNAWSSVLALSVLQFGAAILSIAALAFLGYGDSPPSPEWGVQVSEGKNYVFSAPWMVAVPSVAIVVSVLAFNRLSAFVKELTTDD
ncbi:ABC transporter permease [Nocardia higoensis]|uniref:ABC transporter permease n=1 Tax=Nocardia higoensis TaxID=228599 RepID=UPI0002DF9335|nr:ABC transporter permease [Nocardia higoensis]